MAATRSQRMRWPRYFPPSDLRKGAAWRVGTPAKPLEIGQIESIEERPSASSCVNSLEARRTLTSRLGSVNK